jgi:hypothetical protein
MGIQSDGLANMFIIPPMTVEKAKDDINKLWFQTKLHIKEYKEVCDSLTHTDIIIENKNEYHDYFLELLKPYIQRFGVFSFQVQSLMKLAIEAELSASEVRKQYAQTKTLAAAFNDYLIAQPDRDFKYCNRVISFLDESFMLDRSSEIVKSRHKNMVRMIAYLRKHFRKYMSKLRPKIYVLTNGSATRFEDHTNISDINGIVYITKNEIKKVETDWKAAIEYFKVLNFLDPDIVYIERDESKFYGTINVAPDDSGKTRISYCIDPAVQVISKAIAKCLDYVSRKLGNNCTKDQMRIIRNILRRKDHKNATIISTDMSKYSDTLKIDFILRILGTIGVPHDVLMSMKDLYTLPMYDTVKQVITPRTKASYQGQYGDFSMITLANIWIQCCIYDYFGEYYEFEDNDKTRAGAVGDDTIMVFLKEHNFLFDTIKCFYNCVGVNINRTKTHTLSKGKGCADFIKRFITQDGLVPYIRISPFFSLNINEWIEELLRFYRSNEVDIEYFADICKTVMPEQADWILNLHPINGGAVDRPILIEDLKMFEYRNELLGQRYSNRHEDELHKWINLKHNDGLELNQTALIGFAVHYEEFFEDSEWNDSDEWVDEENNYWNQENVRYTEEAVVDGILHCYTHGYKNARLDGLERMVGYTLSEVRQKMRDIADYLDDFNSAEAYRYMYSQLKRVRTIDVYTRMMSVDLSDKRFRDFTIRPERLTDYSSKQASLDKSLVDQIKKLINLNCSNLGWIYCTETSWEVDKSYLYHPLLGERRLYSLHRIDPRSRDVLSFEEFSEILKDNLRDEEHAHELYKAFIDNLPYNT